MQNKSFVVIGGGTGTFSVLSGLKRYTDQITAIVSMADTGGSAKVERDEWGLLPSSDIRKSLLALADVSTNNSLILRKLFQYRFPKGTGVSGTAFGNLFLVALTKILGSQSQAIEKAGELLNIRGRVLPVTMDKVNLVAFYEDGTRVVGEHAIDDPIHNGKIKITKLITVPKANLLPQVKKIILDSDVIIIGPGGFYTTIIANLVVKGLARIIEQSKAKKIFIMNLMTEYGQTYGFSASTFLTELDKYLNIKTLDYILINNSPIPDPVLTRYSKYNAKPVTNDLKSKLPFKVLTEDILYRKIISAEKGDTLFRSLIRHSPEKIARLILKLTKR